MKKIIVALIFVMSLASFSWAYTGDGSEDDPYVISSYSDFRALKSELNSGSEKYYKLSCDLQLTSLTELIAPIYTGYGTFTEYRIVYADGVSVDVVSYDVVSIDTMGTPQPSVVTGYESVISHKSLILFLTSF